MTRLPDQFVEDKALRDAARDVLMADIAHAKTSLSGKEIAARVGGRIGGGAKDVLEIAKVHADDNRGILAILIGAIIVWFARHPIMDVLGIASDELDSDAPLDDGPQVDDPGSGLAEPETDVHPPIPAGDEDE